MQPQPAALLLLVCPCCCCLLLPSLLGAAAAATVRIGAVVDGEPLLGTEQKIALRIAAKRFSSPGSKLLLNFSDPGGGASATLSAASAAEDLIRRWGADVIVVRAGAWAEAATVGAVGQKARVPVISFVSSDAVPVASVPPFLIRMSTPVSAEVRCVAALVQRYQWRQVIVIYEDDIYGTAAGRVQLLSDALRKVGSDVEERVAFLPQASYPDARRQVRERLKKLQKNLCKVFVVLRASSNLVAHLFREASSLEMMTEHNAWITGDDETTTAVDSISSSAVASHLQGLVGIRIYINESKHRYQVFQASFQRWLRSEYPESRHNTHLDISLLRMYDATNAIAGAAAVGRKGGDNSKGHLLQGILRGAPFQGLSGRVRFDGDGALSWRNSSSFSVLNFDGTRWRGVGFWSERAGFSGRKEAGLEQVIWPGNVREAPGGWGVLQVVVPSVTVFEKFVKVAKGGRGDCGVSPTGFSIDVFEEAVKRLPYPLSREYCWLHDGAYDDLIGAVANGEYHVAAGDITITSNRSEIVGFTQPYVDSNLIQMVPGRPRNHAWLFVMPFTGTVWATILLAFIYTSIILWYLEHHIDYSGINYEWLRHLLEGALWFQFSIFFFKQGRLQNRYSKIVIMVWLIFVFVLASSYNSSLSSILTVQKLRKGGRLGCDGVSFLVKYLQDVQHLNPDEIEKIDTEEGFREAFKSGKITGAYIESPYLREFISSYANQYTTVGEPSRLGGFGFAFQKESPLIVDFSRAILNLTQEGKVKDLETKWFSISLEGSVEESTHNSQGRLGMESLWALFAITFGTSAISFLVFIKQQYLSQGFRMQSEAIDTESNHQEERQVQMVEATNDENTSIEFNGQEESPVQTLTTTNVHHIEE